jgi:hypothetical protein
MRINVNIEQLVLHGFAPGDRMAIAAAVKRELAMQFAAEARAASLRRECDIPCIQGETFQVRPHSGADAVGTQIARAVYRGLRRG